ncbi:hypothetical protein GKE82_23980 [Conexibacter sp. W3-3-2]|uniref:hypothetical protein n=1 Tax=Conexibacter sp. W3-3-2 TaxID=2675227 RepID=UPI0012B84B55|nr:hypothetical protein [Conexibacter sp. W3-3-2]MTD47267.1 hypothetical protein [Conexibacter sp. W3-3-2]
MTPLTRRRRNDHTDGPAPAEQAPGAQAPTPAGPGTGLVDARWEAQSGGRPIFPRVTVDGYSTEHVDNWVRQTQGLLEETSSELKALRVAREMDVREMRDALERAGDARALQARLTELEQRLADQHSSAEDARTRASSAEAEARELRARLEELPLLRQRLVESEQQAAELAALAERERGLREDLAAAESASAELRDQLTVHAQLHADRDTLANKQAEWAKERGEMQARFTQMMADLAAREAEIDRLIAEVNEAKEAGRETDARIAAAAVTAENAVRDLTTLQERHTEVTQQLGAVEQTAADREQQLEALNQRVERMLDDSDRNAREAAEVKDALTRQLIEAQSTIERLERERDDDPDGTARRTLAAVVDADKLKRLARAEADRLVEEAEATAKARLEQSDRACRRQLEETQVRCREQYETAHVQIAELVARTTTSSRDAETALAAATREFEFVVEGLKSRLSFFAPGVLEHAEGSLDDAWAAIGEHNRLLLESRAALSEEIALLRVSRDELAAETLPASGPMAEDPAAAAAVIAASDNVIALAARSDTERDEPADHPPVALETDADEPEPQQPGDEGTDPAGELDDPALTPDQPEEAHPSDAAPTSVPANAPGEDAEPRDELPANQSDAADLVSPAPAPDVVDDETQPAPTPPEPTTRAQTAPDRQAAADREPDSVVLADAVEAAFEATPPVNDHATAPAPAPAPTEDLEVPPSTTSVTALPSAPIPVPASTGYREDLPPLPTPTLTGTPQAAVPAAVAPQITPAQAAAASVFSELPAIVDLGLGLTSELDPAFLDATDTSDAGQDENPGGRRRRRSLRRRD